MQSGFLTYQQSNIHYRFGGKGSRALVCFHGYGESSLNFQFLEQGLSRDYLIIAIDLPFHGKTAWRGDTLDPATLADIVSNIIAQLPVAKNDTHLMGFSLGGRLALSVVQEMPDRISKLVLLAPDGLTVNFWYWLSTQTKAGRSLFKLTMSRPGWFLGLLKMGNKLGLINQSIFKFVRYYIHDEQVRKELYDRWTNLRQCTPDIARIRKLVRQYDINVQLLYGRHDRIIGHTKGQSFVKSLPGCNVELINCGHQVLHEKNMDAIAKALLF